MSLKSKVTLKKIILAYMLTLGVITLLADLDWWPHPEELAMRYAPHSWVAQHFPRRLPYDDKVAHVGLPECSRLS